MEVELEVISKKQKKKFLSTIQSRLDEKLYYYHGIMKSYFQYSLRKAKGRSEPTHYITVAKYKEKVIGVLTLVKMEERFLVSVFVKARYRSRGIGSLLLKEVLKETRLKKKQLFNTGAVYPDKERFFSSNKIKQEWPDGFNFHIQITLP